MHKKDYKKWHEKKIKINDIKNRPFFHEREVWYCHLGENVGFEQDGSGGDYLRPVVIIKKFNNEIFWAIPLTTKSKKNKKYYFEFTLSNTVQNTAILSQIKLLDGLRLSYKIGEISDNNFKKLIEKIKEIFP